MPLLAGDVEALAPALSSFGNDVDALAAPAPLPWPFVLRTHPPSVSVSVPVVAGKTLLASVMDESYSVLGSSYALET